MSKKNKKKKVTYIDDGRTIADMSGVGKKKPDNTKLDRLDKPSSSFKAQWETYWSTVKLMFVPMLVVIGIISIAFLIMYLML